MSLILEKYAATEEKVKGYLLELQAKPPMGFGSVVPHIIQSFQMCSLLGALVKGHDKQLRELKEQIREMQTQLEQLTEAQTNE